MHVTCHVACRIQPGDFLGMFAGGAWLGAAPVAATEPVDRPDLAANVASKSLPLLDLSPGSASTVYYNITLGVRGPLHALHQRVHHISGFLTCTRRRVRFQRPRTPC